MARPSFAAVRAKAVKITNRKRNLGVQLGKLEDQVRDTKRKIAECDALLGDLRAENPEWSGKIPGEHGWTDAGH